jgi:hypothetical protein
MRLLIGIMILLIIIGLAESVQVGGTKEKVILLGSLTKNLSGSENVSNATNETNATSMGSTGVAIKNPMSIAPVSNRFKSTTSPNSIEANTIAYRFTT